MTYDNMKRSKPLMCHELFDLWSPRFMVCSSLYISAFQTFYIVLLHYLTCVHTRYIKILQYSLSEFQIFLGYFQRSTTWANLWWTLQRATRPLCSNPTWSTVPCRRTYRQLRPVGGMIKWSAFLEIRKNRDRRLWNSVIIIEIGPKRVSYFDEHLECKNHGKNVISRA